MENLLRMETESDALAMPATMGARIEEEAGEKARRYRRNSEERYSSIVAGRRYWKLLAFLLVLINGGEGYGIWTLAHSSRTELYVVDRAGSQINYAGSLKPTNMDEATWDLVRVEQLKKFISAWRTVTSDAAAQKADWDLAFAFVGDGSQAHDVLAKWYEANDPLVRGGKGEIVTVQYRTYDREGANTYGIWWAETTTALSGQSVSTKLWHMRVTYASKVPSSEQARAANPMGILATELTFSEVQQ
jgi:type IV secretory pathway TrbF-like protein